MPRTPINSPQQPRRHGKLLVCRTASVPPFMQHQLISEPVPAAGKKKKKNQASGSKNAMDLILTDRQGVWKGLRKLQKKQRKEVIEKRKKQKTKSAIEKYQENTHDYTEASVMALQRLTELGKVDDRVAEKILYKQPCRLSRDIKEQVSETAKSIFTEEDFDKFEKEYRPK